MNFLKRIPVFRIKIIYKSGATHEFWVKKFSMSGGRYHWESAEDSNKPLLLGVDEIAAVYQTSVKYRFF